MFSLNLILAAFPFFALTSAGPVADWKTAYGWNGTGITAEELSKGELTPHALVRYKEPLKLYGLSWLTDFRTGPQRWRCVFLYGCRFHGHLRKWFREQSLRRGHWPQSQALVTGFGSGACVPVGSDFDNVVSSFGPDPGLTCTIFRSAILCRVIWEKAYTNLATRAAAAFRLEVLSSPVCAGFLMSIWACPARAELITGLAQVSATFSPSALTTKWARSPAHSDRPTGRFRDSTLSHRATRTRDVDDFCPRIRSRCNRRLTTRKPAS